MVGVNPIAFRLTYPSAAATPLSPTTSAIAPVSSIAELRRRLLDEPCAYILFPEGARSRDGAMLPLKPRLGMLVAETDVPVVPCYLEGCFEACPAERRLPRPSPISLRIGEPSVFAKTPNHREGWREIVGQMESRVRELGGVKV